MKNMRISAALLTVLILSSSAAFSQKQTDNFAGPAQVRIDGKINEWTSPFQVNKPTKLSYLIANDKRNLYLVLQSEDSLVNSRILLTGITFMVNPSGKKKEGPLVMFPVVDRTDMAASMRGGGTAAAATMPAADLIKRHQTMISQVKEIMVAGFKEITEDNISIYNEYGIKGAGSFDNNDHFIYELAIPLSLLGLSPDNDQEVAYNIKINGSAGSNLRTAGFPGGFGGGGERGGGGSFGGGDRGGAGGFGGGDRAGGFGAGGGFDRGAGGGRAGNVNQNRFYEATDFWVNLKLAKVN